MSRREIAKIAKEIKSIKSELSKSASGQTSVEDVRKALKDIAKTMKTKNWKTEDSWDYDGEYALQMIMKQSLSSGSVKYQLEVVVHNYEDEGDEDMTMNINVRPMFTAGKSDGKWSDSTYEKKMTMYADQMRKEFSSKFAVYDAIEGKIKPYFAMSMSDIDKVSRKMVLRSDDLIAKLK